MFQTEKAPSAFKFQSQPRCQAPGDNSQSSIWCWIVVVSISTEMPGPWRLGYLHHGTRISSWFQSQPRCQAPGDDFTYKHIKMLQEVSISTEMPGPWRR